MTPELIDERFVLTAADKAVLMLLLIVGSIVAVVFGYAIGTSIDGMVADLMRWWGR